MLNFMSGSKPRLGTEIVLAALMEALWPCYVFMNLSMAFHAIILLKRLNELRIAGEKYCLLLRFLGATVRHLHSTLGIFTGGRKVLSYLSCDLIPI